MLVLFLIGTSVLIENFSTDCIFSFFFVDQTLLDMEQENITYKKINPNLNLLEHSKPAHYALFYLLFDVHIQQHLIAVGLEYKDL